MIIILGSLRLQIVQGVTSEALIDCFIGGLKSDIQRDGIAQSPTTLLRCVSLAKLFEEKYLPKHKPFQNSYPNCTPNTSSNTNLTFSQSIKSTSLPPLLLIPTKSNSNGPKLGIVKKKISPTEMHIHREKGLCYTCDEKFTSSHRCRNMTYLLL